MLMLLLVWSRAAIILMSDPRLPTTAKLAVFSVVLLTAWGSLAGVLPTHTWLEADRIVHRSFGFRTRSIPLDQVRDVVTQGTSLFLVLPSGELLLLATGEEVEALKTRLRGEVERRTGSPLAS